MQKSRLGVISAGLLFLLANFVGAASAQTADELVAKYMQARGGLDKIKAIDSIRMTATMAMPNMEVPVIMMMKRPNSLRMEFTVQGSTGVRAFDGTTGWSQTPFLGNPGPVMVKGSELDELRDEADLDGALVDYQKKGSKLEFLGKDKVHESDAYKLRLTRADGKVELIYLDATSYLDVKEEGKHIIEGVEREVETYINDYRELNGMKFPYEVQSGVKDDPAQHQKLNIEKLELNVPMDPALFRVPSVGAPAK